jgi:hypothetical protein
MRGGMRGGNKDGMRGGMRSGSKDDMRGGMRGGMRGRTKPQMAALVRVSFVRHLMLRVIRPVVLRVDPRYTTTPPLG